MTMKNTKCAANIAKEFESLIILQGLCVVKIPLFFCEVLFNGVIGFETHSHTVFECVEFAEGDSCFCAPDAFHHFNDFDIIGVVVLRVIYFLHILLSFYCECTIKTLHISQRGGEHNLWKDKATHLNS